MKVACIGNMNNNFFNLVRYLRDNQIDAELLLFNNDFDHFHPSADSYDDEYKSYTKQLSWGSSRSFILTSIKKIKKDLEEYDFFIGCGLTPAFFYKIGYRLDLFVPYGSDLYEAPFISKTNLKSFIVSAITSFFQRKGIKNSRYISFVSTNPSFENIFKTIKTKGQRIYAGVPMVYLPEYTSTNIQKNLEKFKFNTDFKKIRENNDLIVFHHSRLVWKNLPDQWSYKGSEKLIKGFANFVKNNSAIRSTLILFEYGIDVEETKNLIKELNIEKFVYWLPKMNRKDIMIAMCYADICAGETGMSWFTYGVLYEALTMAKPFMGYRKDELYTNLYPELYPMINVFSEEDISLALSNSIDKKIEYQTIGLGGYEWLKKYAIDTAVKDYLQIITKKI